MLYFLTDFKFSLELFDKPLIFVRFCNDMFQCADLMRLWMADGVNRASSTLAKCFEQFITEKSIRYFSAGSLISFNHFHDAPPRALDYSNQGEMNPAIALKRLLSV